MNLDMIDSKGVQPIANMLSSIEEGLISYIILTLAVTSIESALQVLGQLHSNNINPFFKVPFIFIKVHFLD